MACIICDVGIDVVSSFRCDDVITLQFDWMFLILGQRAKYLNLVNHTVFGVQIYTGWVQD